MDKFGIFELLDTLSQITSSATEEQTTPETPPLSPDDKAFLPPDLGGNSAPDAQNRQRDALNSLYERHERISKQIDKNK